MFRESRQSKRTLFSHLT